MYENQKTVRFMNTNDVTEFVSAAEQCDFDIDVKYLNCLIDAKSILGMFAIGLRNTITVCYGGKNDHFERIIGKYMVA